MDIDNSGQLNREEFEAVVMVLFGNVMTRVAIQYSFTLLIVPLIAQLMLYGIMQLLNYVFGIIATLDEHNAFFKHIEMTLETVWKTTTDYWATSIPLPVIAAVEKAQDLLGAIPESIWNTIPLTLLSTVLCLVLVPWSLLKIDGFFQGLADRPKAAK
jgi:hypothetical protein